MTTKIKVRASRKRLVWGSILTVSVIILVLSRIYGWTHYTPLDKMYEGGSGVPQDDAQTVQWYREAARNALAHIGVPQDSAQVMVFFDENGAQLAPEGQKVVDSAATMALAKPDYRLELIGHDDSVLSDPQSLTLSQERAKETARSLVKRGVPANRIFVGGVGSSEPLEPAKKGVPAAINRFVRIQFLPLTDKTTKAYLQQFKGE